MSVCYDFTKGICKKEACKHAKKKRHSKATKNMHKNMQMEMPDLKHATYLHAVVQLVVVSFYLRSG